MRVITQVIDAADIEETRTLFGEYQVALGIDLEFQDFTKELASLPGVYYPV